MHHNEEKSFDMKTASEFANFLVYVKNETLNNENPTDNLLSITNWQTLVYTGLSFVLFLFIVLLCGCCCKHIRHIFSMSRQRAYNNLVQHGFFKQWIIQDLTYLQYNPEGLANH